LDRPPAAYGAPGGVAGPGPAPGPAAHSRAQYDEPLPALGSVNPGSYAAPAASRFPDPHAIGGAMPLDRWAVLAADPAESTLQKQPELMQER
jgi:hypothetical protein